MTKLSAAMDGQPRHQHRSPSAASHRTIAWRLPKPFEADRARHQRRLKASSHEHIRRKTFAPTTLPASSSSGEQTNNSHCHQQNLNQQRSGGSRYRIIGHDQTIEEIEKAGQPTQKSKQSQRRQHQKSFLATGKRLGENIGERLSARQTFMEYKGCQRQSSKGGN